MDESQGQQEEQQEPSEKLILSIFLTKDGAVKVQGMINDKILSYGILESAREAIYQHHTQSKVQIVKPRNAIIDFMRGQR